MKTVRGAIGFWADVVAGAGTVFGGVGTISGAMGKDTVVVAWLTVGGAVTMVIALDVLDCVCPKRLEIGITITSSAFESALPSDEKKESRVVIT
jgi:hypothetical protein